MKRKPTKRVQLKCPVETMTKQSMQDECNINHIVQNYHRTGALPQHGDFQPEYGFADSITFQDSMNIVASARTMFAEQPSSIRKKFKNDPGLFLDFVNDEKNQEEMIKLGLATRDPDHPSAKPKDPVKAQEDLVAKELEKLKGMQPAASPTVSKDKPKEK